MEEQHDELPPQVDIEQRLNEKIAAGIRFDFDTFFADGWRIFKQTFWMVAVSLILIIIPIFIISVILGPLLATSQSQTTFQPGDSPGFEDIMRVIEENQRQVGPLDYLKQSIFNFIILLIMAPLQAGWLYISREADKDGAGFGEIFTFYKHPLTGRVITAGLITTGISVLTSFVLNFVPVVGPLINIIFAIAYYYLFLYVVPFIIFGNATPGKALSLSIKLFFAKPWPAIGFTLLFGLLAFSGIIACCVGVIFTIAFTPICNYLLYKHSVGFPQDDEAPTDEPHWQQQQPTV